MVRVLLRLDYALSCWFSKTNDKIIPGTAFLFLNKVSFIWVVVLFLLSSVFEFNKRINLFVGITVLGSVVILYGFQRTVERIIRKEYFNKEFKKLKAKEVNKRRIVALTLFVFCLALMLVSGVFLFKK